MTCVILEAQDDCEKGKLTHTAPAPFTPQGSSATAQHYPSLMSLPFPITSFQGQPPMRAEADA